MDWKLELVGVPVTDVDRAKKFYTEQAGFVADHDHRVNEDLRFVQCTPPGSACSIAFGTNLSPMAPGTLQGLQMVVVDIDAARQELLDRGVEVSDVESFPWGRFVYFSDPDGNGWAVQEIPRPGCRADRGQHLVERVHRVAAHQGVDVRQGGRHAGHQRLVPGGGLRGLTHTIRWARRASRAICSPRTVGSPVSHPSDTITTTAAPGHPPTAVAVVELRAARRRCGCRPTSRGPRPAARRRARSGLVDRRLAGQRGSAGWRTRRPPPARPHRPVQQVEVGAGVGLHRARDVGDEHEPPGPLGPAAELPTDRVAAVAVRPPEGGPHVEAPAPRVAHGAAAGPRRARRGQRRRSGRGGPPAPRR